MSRYDDVENDLRSAPSRWAVTGGAGFIGSHLTERLLRLDQQVVVIDDFSTGFEHNLEQVREAVGSERAARLSVVRGDVSDLPDMAERFDGVRAVLHQGALGSVPRSIEDPAATHKANVDGTFKVLKAAVDAGVDRVVFASSSSVYGDDEVNPRSEERMGRPLSPYAASKRCGELYMEGFAAAYGLCAVSLRYFNVFGPRQNPKGAYAAVIPAWIGAALAGRACVVNGDGLTSRDFCYIENVVQANLLAATTEAERVKGRAFNVGCGDNTDLNTLHDIITARVRDLSGAPELPAEYRDFRAGDVRHSQAVIDRARAAMGYEPDILIDTGLGRTVDWYAARA